MGDYLSRDHDPKYFFRVGAPVLVLEPIQDRVCAECVDETHVQHALVPGSRLLCKACGTEFKVVQADGEYGDLVKAVLDEAISPPGEFDDDPGVVELAAKCAPLSFRDMAFTEKDWSPAKAEAWLKRNGFRTDKVFDGGNHVTVFPQIPVSWMDKSTLRIISFGKGIRAVVGKVLKQFEGQTPSVDDLGLPKPKFPEGR